MTHKEIAERLRDMSNRIGSLTQSSLAELADELDPPLPEPGTVVWWRFIGALAYHGWEHGVVDKSLKGVWSSDGLVHWSRIEYKPARIAGPMQEIVDIPPVKDWPRNCDEVELKWHYDDRDFMSGSAGATITRGEAARREAEG